MKVNETYTLIKNNYENKYRCKYKNELEIDKYKTMTKTTNNDIDIEIDIESELYRLDILKIFKIKKYNENNITQTIDCIYDHFIKYNQQPNVIKFKNIINKASNLFLSEDVKLGLTILYSYEYMNETHNCICEIIDKNNIDDKTIEKLEKIIN